MFQGKMTESIQDVSVGFAPIARADARVLVLGSLPGRRSLETGEYYAHPRNAFWPIMQRLAKASGSYAERCRRLQAAGIAVWDVLHAAVRPGSLDSSISLNSAQTNDFEQFFSAHPFIECIGFNGRAAESLFRKRVMPQLDVGHARVCLLPSTSPAHAALSIGEKARIWRSMLSPSLHPAQKDIES